MHVCANSTNNQINKEEEKKTTKKWKKNSNALKLNVQYMNNVAIEWNLVGVWLPTGPVLFSNSRINNDNRQEKSTTSDKRSDFDWSILFEFQFWLQTFQSFQTSCVEYIEIERERNHRRTPTIEKQSSSEFPMDFFLKNNFLWYSMSMHIYCVQVCYIK